MVAGLLLLSLLNVFPACLFVMLHVPQLIKTPHIETRVVDVGDAWLQEKWEKELYIASVCYGRTVS